MTVAAASSSSPASPLDRAKPRLRGVSHLAAFHVVLGAGLTLVAMAPTPRARLAAAVYSVCLAALFGISALYHVPHWGPRPRAVLRRADHAAIFLFIAGSYTPMAMLVPMAGRGDAMLRAMWIGAALGVAKSLLWSHAPRWITALLYVALGWASVPYLGDLGRGLGPVNLALLVGGGVIYSIGAAIYARKRPDPSPAVFGYHEIFHALVIVASGCLFALTVRIVDAATS